MKKSCQNCLYRNCNVLSNPCKSCDEFDLHVFAIGENSKNEADYSAAILLIIITSIIAIAGIIFLDVLK